MQDALKDKANRPMFLRLLHEVEANQRQVRKELDELCRALVSYTNADTIEYRNTEYRIHSRQNWKKQNEANIKRLEYYLAHYKKNKPIDMSVIRDEAKQVLISVVLHPLNPAHSTPQRWTYLCPLHSENTPSFVYFVEQNRWHCFGCSEGGDVISLVMKMKQYSFSESIRFLVHTSTT